MNDRISRKAAIDEIRKCRFVVDAIEKIRGLPSADRPKGEWIRTGRTNIYGGIEVQCSNCGDKVIVQHLEDEWYCRHCGADMGMEGADDDFCSYGEREGE